MPFFKRIVRDYFTFNRRERRGIAVLLVILTVLSAAHIVIRFTPTSNVHFDFSQLVVSDSVVYARDYVDTSAADKSNEKEPVVWNRFDPNLVSPAQLVSFGLDSSIAVRIEKYRDAGGKFRKPEDLKKIYGLNEDWYESASKYIQIKTESPADTGTYKPYWAQLDSSVKTTKIKIERFELNTVDSATLVKVPWVGAFTSGEIIDLRARLNGFRSYDQLLDIYRISDQAVENIIKYSTLDTTLVGFIDINECDLKTLGRHPYLTWKQAKIILNYRDQHGPYMSIDGILKTSVINDSVYSKIAPYLTIGR